MMLFLSLCGQNFLKRFDGALFSERDMPPFLPEYCWCGSATASLKLERTLIWIHSVKLTVGELDKTPFSLLSSRHQSEFEFQPTLARNESYEISFHDNCVRGFVNYLVTCLLNKFHAHLPTFIENSTGSTIEHLIHFCNLKIWNNKKTTIFWTTKSD